MKKALELASSIKTTSQAQAENITSELTNDFKKHKENLNKLLQDGQSTIENAMDEMVESIIVRSVEQLSRLQTGISAERVKLEILIAEIKADTISQVQAMQEQIITAAQKDIDSHLAKIKQDLQGQNTYIDSTIGQQKTALATATEEIEQSFQDFNQSIQSLKSQIDQTKQTTKQLTTHSQEIQNQAKQDLENTAQQMQDYQTQALAILDQTLTNIEKKTTTYIIGKTWGRILTAAWVVFILIISIMAMSQVKTNRTHKQELQMEIKQQQQLLQDLRARTPTNLSTQQALNLVDIEMAGDSLILRAKYPGMTTTSSHDGFTAIDSHDTMTIQIK